MNMFLRLEPRHLIVDRHVLPLHPHRVLAPKVDALPAVQPTTDRQLLELHAHITLDATCT